MFNTELFVVEVQKRPCLWNLKDSSHGDRQVKLRAWEQIAKVLNESSDLYSLNSKNITTDELQRKWKHLRDYYTREKKKTSAADKNAESKDGDRGTAGHRRKSPLLDLLQFLDANRESDIIHVTVERNVEEENFESQTDEEEERNVAEYDFAIARPCKVQRVEIQQPQPKIVAEDIENSSEMQFLASLLPIIRKMSVKERFRFRAQLLTPTPQQYPFSVFEEEEKSRTMEARKRQRLTRESSTPPRERSEIYIKEEKFRSGETQKRHATKSQTLAQEVPASFAGQNDDRTTNIKQHSARRKSQTPPQGHPVSRKDEQDKSKPAENRKRQRVTCKSEEIKGVNKETISAEGALKRDEFSIYGEYVANKLRNIRNSHARHTAEFHINGILYRAEMGEYDAMAKDSSMKTSK